MNLDGMMLYMVTHLEQIVIILEAHLTGYIYEIGGTAPSFTVTELNPTNSIPIYGDDEYEIVLRATTEANLDTIIALLRKLDGKHASGYSPTVEGYPNHIAVSVKDKYVTEAIIKLNGWWNL